MSNRTSADRIDPTTLGVVRELLVAIVREMRVNLARSAYSTIITEGHDFSCALFAATGDLVAQSEDNPAHIFPLPMHWKAVTTQYPDDVAPGDIFIINDTYLGGTHLNDIAIYAPRSAAGRATLFPAIRAHFGDVGGAVAGSISGQSRHIFEEGIRIPPLRLAVGEELNDEIVRLFLHNVRDPDERYGDLMAMIGTARVAARRLAELEDKYGSDTVIGVSNALLDGAERRMRAAIRAWPDGDYRYENYLDSSGGNSEPMRISLKLTVKGESISCDFTDTSPQGAGPINGSLANTASGCFIVLKSFLDPASPINSGCFRSLSVNAPEGSLLNAKFPAPVGGSGETRRTVEATVAAVVSQIVPDLCSGDLKGAANHCYLSGPEVDCNASFLFYEYSSGGSGAMRGQDGENMVRAYNEGDFNSVQAIETLELRCPLRVESSVLRQNSGGAGEWRGGLGIERRIRIMRPATSLSVLTDRVMIPPYGVSGGAASLANRFTVLRNGKTIEPSDIPGKITAFPLEVGDIVVCQSAGGGGYGDPLRRPPESVLRDVENDLVSLESARDAYGVVIRNGAVVKDETVALREALRGARQSVTVRSANIDESEGARRILRIATETADRLAIGEGDVVELVPAEGAPLRIFAHVDQHAVHGEVRIGPVAKLALTVRDGDTVRLRPLFTPYHYRAPNGARQANSTLQGMKQAEA